MAVTSNISDLEKLILDQSEFVEKDLPGELAALVGKIQQELIAGGRGGKDNKPFQTRTGNLRRSMQTTLLDYGLSVEMLFYGWFLTFGVDGRKYANANGLTPEVAGAFGVADGYRFGQNTQSPNVFGILPYNFYNIDIEEEIIKILEKGYE
jgi:hypothetical protein